MLEFSVVVCVWGTDRNFLNYSVPNIVKLNPDEIVFVTDHGDTKTVKTVIYLMSRLKFFRFRFKFISDSKDWKFKVAYVKRSGFDAAIYPNILIVDADVIIDKNIKNYFPLISKFKHVSFIQKPYPVNARMCLQRVLIHLGLVNCGLGNTNFFSKDSYLECEDRDSIKQVLQGEDTHLKGAIASRYPTACFLSDCIHLREQENSSYQFMRGRCYWIDLKQGFLKTVFTGIVYLRFAFIRGYIKERYGFVSS